MGFGPKSSLAQLGQSSRLLIDLSLVQIQHEEACIIMFGVLPERSKGVRLRRTVETLRGSNPRHTKDDCIIDQTT